MGKRSRQGRRDRSSDDSEDDSLSLLSRDEGEGRQKRRKKENKKDRRREHDKRRSDSRHSSSKRRSKKKKRSRRDRKESSGDDSDSDSFVSRSSDEESSSTSSSYRERRRRDRKKKRKRKEEKKKKKARKRERSNKDPSSNAAAKEEHTQKFALADALLALLTKHPGFSEELPILLIRLCSGTTFSLEQSPVQQLLGQILTQLEPFGVYKDETGTFGYKAPLGATMHHQKDPELALVRVVRKLLSDIGLSASVVETYEHPSKKKPPPMSNPPETEQDTKIKKNSSTNDVSRDIPAFVQRMLSQFPGLDKELVGLCNTILKGESVSVEGLPNEALKDALSSLLEMCQLDLCEMADEDEEDSDDNENNDEKDDTDDNEPTMGYGLPDKKDDTKVATTNLNAIIQACTVKAPRVVGPMRPPANYAQQQEDSDDDEGPQLTPRLPTMSESQVQSLQKRRQLELERVKAGLDPSVPDGAEAGREEWMLVPGKYDFLDSVKSGKPMRNRQFQNLKNPGNNDEEEEEAVDPKIQSEMNQLLSAHQEARGPSLMDEHQAAKKREKEESSKTKKDWQWNRQKDLDAGRRVDKDALQMVLGGAADGLKSKFQGVGNDDLRTAHGVHMTIESCVKH